MSGETWASDVPVSQPSALPFNTPALKDFGGFAFSVNGMVHNVNEAELESLMVPTFAPDGYAGVLRSHRLPVDRFDKEGDYEGET